MGLDRYFAPAIIHPYASSFIRVNTMAIVASFLSKILALCSFQIVQEVSITKDCSSFLEVHADAATLVHQPCTVSV